jgi:hypothetical protein
MSIRRAQDERIEGTPDGLNAISEIMDVPDAPTIGTAVDNGNVDASVTFTAAVTGGTPSTYTVTSTPGSFTGTGSSSPITVSGLTAGTSYTFKVKAANAAGTYGPESVASNSVTPAFPVVGAYDSLAAVTLSATASSITFAGIPSGYKHLQIRGFFRATSGSLNAGFLRLNGDSGNNYNFHQLFGNGTTASSNGSTPSANMYFQKIPGSSDLASAFGTAVIDILDYSNTSKNKVMRYLGGADANGTGFVFLGSNGWYNTAAVTSVTLLVDSSSFDTYSSFALYGVK